MSSYPFHDLIGCNGIINILMISKKGSDKRDTSEKKTLLDLLLIIFTDDSKIKVLLRQL